MCPRIGGDFISIFPIRKIGGVVRIPAAEWTTVCFSQGESLEEFLSSSPLDWTCWMLQNDVLKSPSRFETSSQTIESV